MMKSDHQTNCVFFTVQETKAFNVIITILQQTNYYRRFCCMETACGKNKN